MARIHWAPPDMSADILREARRPDAAEPVSVHVRPEVHAVICQELGADPATGTVPAWNGIRLVVDDSIPAVPGFEIHRAAAPERLAG
jgi:hypothetical protein